VPRGIFAAVTANECLHADVEKISNNIRVGDRGHRMDLGSVRIRCAAGTG
jgi:hypothetical protein